MFILTRPQALAQLRRRKKEFAGKQIDNSSLIAGSPMYYYCKSCGAHICTLPEDHMCAAPKYCEFCKNLKDNGYIE